MRRLWLLWIFALFAAASPARAETVKEQLRTLQQQSLVAYKAGKFDDCAKGFAAALAIRPHHPRFLYNFAVCSTKAGAASDAIAALDGYASMGLVADVEKDSDFDSLKELPAFKAVLAKFAANRIQVGASRIAATVSGEPFLAEGIAFDPTSKRFFISSVDQRKVVQVAADGNTSDFVPAGTHDLLGAFGMAIDQKRQLLWVASSGMPHARDLREVDRRTAGISSFSLQGLRTPGNGSIRAKDRASAGVIGDVFVGDEDWIYATDSVLPRICSMPTRSNASQVVIWMESDAFGSLQGIASTPDEKAFIVADYAAGLHFIDRKTKAFTTVGFAGGTTLLGIDGIYRRDNTLLAVQNGVNPQRLLAVTLDASGRNVANVKVLAANDPNILEPSLGTIANDEFCVVANAQWSRFTDDGVRKEKLDPPRIACIAIPK